MTNHVALYFLHSLADANVFNSIVTHWVGDGIGAVIFTPLVLIACATPRDQWRSRFFPIGLPLLACFVATMLVYIFISHLSPTLSLALFFLIGGLIFCLVMETLLFILYSQKSMIQMEVIQRTQELAAEESKNKLLLNSAVEGICQIDKVGQVTYINPAGSSMLGYSSSELLGKKFHLTIQPTRANGTPYPLELSPLYDSLTTGRTHQLEGELLWRKERTAFWVDYSCTPLRSDGAIIGAMIMFHDITKQHDAHLEIEHMAHFDALTNIPNRSHFLSHVPEAMQRTSKNHAILALCFIDIDNFKIINDTLGHSVGDILLHKIPELIKPLMRKDDFLARLGGDEFALLLENIHSIHEVHSIAQRYVALFQQPIIFPDVELKTTISMGITLYPGGGNTAEELIKNADMAMYKAKENGRNGFAFFDERIFLNIERQHKIEAALPLAHEKNEFYLLYQPVIQLSNHKIIGMEVLIRWAHPSLGEISPEEFIPIAERTGAIHAIDQWVTETACTEFQNKILSQAALSMAYLSINVSVRELEQPFYSEQLKKVLAKTKISPSQLVLEVTESALMKHPKSVINAMENIHRIGVLFALDDFGTAHSSMQYLKTLPIAFLKIDKAFVRDISKNENDRLITKAIIELAHSLKIKTIAEGIETSQQLSALVEQNCDAGQGFYLCTPSSLEDICKRYI